MTKSYFEDAADALRGFVPREYRSFGWHATVRNLKVWFDEPHEHYEVQWISSKVITRAKLGTSGALEVGFHAEHPTASLNESLLEQIRAAERRWRRTLGPDVQAGAFIGRPSPWRRISELWPTDDLDDDGWPIEAAERLASYVRVIEPLRRARS